MKKAIVPFHEMGKLPCIFEILIGGWMIQCMGEDDSVGQYVVLKG